MSYIKNVVAKNSVRLALSLALAGGCALAYAQAQPPAAEVPSVKAALEKLYPGTPFKSVEKTPVPGIYQVVMGREVAYVSEDGRYFMFNAHLFDMKTQTDLSKAAVDRAQSIDFKSLPLKDAIKQVKGNGKRVLAVFTDPDCPYCRQLEQTLDKMDDITIYRFLDPIEGLHKGAVDKSRAIWCDGKTDAARLESMKQFMAKSKSTGDTSCANPIERNVALAGKLGINGTPTLIAGDGRMLPGYLPPDRLNAWLNGKAVR